MRPDTVDLYRRVPDGVLHGVSFRVLREQFLSLPRELRRETVARAHRCSRPGSALEALIRRGLYEEAGL